METSTMQSPYGRPEYHRRSQSSGMIHRPALLSGNSAGSTSPTSQFTQQQQQQQQQQQYPLQFVSASAATEALSEAMKMRTQIFEDRLRLREKQDKALREAISRVDDVERLYYDLKATAPSRVTASLAVEAKTSSPPKSTRRAFHHGHRASGSNKARNSLGIGRRATNLPSNFDLTKIKLMSQNDALLRRASRLRKELARHHGKMDLVLATAVAVLEAQVLEADRAVGQKREEDQLKISTEFEDLLPKALREGGFFSGSSALLHIFTFSHTSAAHDRPRTPRSLRTGHC